MQPEKFWQNSDKAKSSLTEEMCVIPVKDKNCLPPQWAHASFGAQWASY
jgi:hypothetical protein